MPARAATLCTCLLLACGQIAAPAQETTQKREVSERLVAEIGLYSCIEGTLTVSPDSKRVAWVAQGGIKQFVVVDGKEGKLYDGPLVGSRIVFDSNDSLL